ncbi:MAG: PAS domain S-box protein [Ignavibacteria bacterium]|nr:PAS domain S-box protein [Ignavibacteria bacterium]
MNPGKDKLFPDNLQQDLSLYRRIFNNSYDCIAILNSEGEYVEQNTAHQKFFGLSNFDIIGETPSVIFGEEKFRKIQESLIKKGTHTEEIHVTGKDGNVLITNFSAFALRKNNLGPVNYVYNLRSVTIDQNADEELKKSENKYKQLIEKSLQAIIIIQDSKIVYTNKSFSGISGYSIEELLSFTPNETVNLVHPDDQEMIWGNLRKRMDGLEIPPHYQFRGISKDGITKILDLYASDTEFEGKPAIQGFILDITDQVEAQKSIDKRTKFIETILNNLPLGIAVNEINSGKSTFINKEFQEISGWTKKEIPNLRKLFKKALNNPDKGKNISNKIRSDIKEKKPENLFWDNIELESKAGDKKYLSAKTIPLYDQDLIILTVQDITERIIADKQIQNSLKEKEILLREIHHRVKNNLQTISSLLDLQAESINDSAALEAFRSSQSRIRSMALIHERLYKSENLSRIKAQEYIKNLTDYLEATYDSQAGNIKLKTNIQNILLNLDTAIPCGLIINELVSNSMKYAFPEDQAGTIEVSLLVSSADNISLSVRDDGIGIPADITVKNSPSLGLQLVYLLAKQINGTLITERENGTKVEIIFSKLSMFEEVVSE